jgi:hypothetical protein
MMHNLVRRTQLLLRPSNVLFRLLDISLATNQPREQTLVGLLLAVVLWRRALT